MAKKTPPPAPDLPEVLGAGAAYLKTRAKTYHPAADDATLCGQPLARFATRIPERIALRRGFKLCPKCKAATV